ncbi:MAG: hypothetical protein WC061_04010 [Melioribacteraceae bacterium]
MFGAGAVLMFLLLITACSNEDNPIVSPGETSKVSGRISSSNGMAKILSKSGSSESAEVSVQGALVTLAQVQADGSLKTVSTQSVQTDVSGKFVVETNLSNVNNLIIVAEQGAIKWKAIVSSTVRSGATVYAPPLNDESSTEAELYIRVVGGGYSGEVSESDIKALLTEEAAIKIRGNATAETQFINAVRAKSQAMTQAAANSYFGISGTQMQAFVNAKAAASAKMDEESYASGDSEAERENHFRSYEGNVISACASNNINATTYAELTRIGLSAFSSASASMEPAARLALSKSFYKRFAVTLGYAMNQQFQAAGASNAQVNLMASAGTTLYNSIKNSSDLDQISSAFVQYHATAKTQLQLALSAYSGFIETLDTSINSGTGAKAVLTSSFGTGASAGLIINGYVSFYNTVKTLVQAALVGASSSQVNAASHILIIANMN